MGIRRSEPGRVDADHDDTEGADTALADIGPASSRDADPELAAAECAHADRAHTDAVEVTAALDATGLYHDEAVAMVNTWKRQWFATPGVRVLYLMPQSWTDAAIPLTIKPAPEETLRVMMIRVEVITSELEQADAAMAKLLADPGTEGAGRAYFTALGRFAEPRLRRSADTRVRLGE